MTHGDLVQESAHLSTTPRLYVLLHTIYGGYKHEEQETGWREKEEAYP